MKKKMFRNLLGGFFLLALSFQSLVWADGGTGTPPPTTMPPSPPSAPTLSNFFYSTDAGNPGRYFLSTRVNAFGVGDHNGASCEYKVRNLVMGIPPAYADEWRPASFTYLRHDSLGSGAYYCNTITSVELPNISIASDIQMRVTNSASLSRVIDRPTLDNTAPEIGDRSSAGDFHLTEASRAYTATRGSLSYTFVPRRISFAANLSDVGSGVVSCGYSLSTDRSGFPEYGGMILSPIPDPAGSGSMIGQTCLFENIEVPNNPTLSLQAMDHVGNISILTLGQVLVVDDQAPESRIQVLPTTTTTNTFNLTYNASEIADATHSGLDKVWIYYRYRANSSAEWGPLYQYGDPVTPTANTGTVAFTAAQGNGLYEFFSGACDHVSNCEDQPSIFDANTNLQVSTVVPAANLAVSSGPLSFGSVNVGQSSAAQTLTLRNSGTATLNIESVTLTGEAASQFVLTSCREGVVNLEPNQTCDVSVLFRPTSVGSKTAAVRVLSNAGGTAGNIISVSLTGTAVNNSPDFDLALSSAPAITLGRNATSAVNLTVTRRNGFTGDVVVTISSSNPGITADALTIPAAATTGVLTLRTNGTIENNTYTVNVIGTSSGISHAVSLSVGVNTSITTPPASGGGGGCALVADSASSFALFSWMIALVSLLGFRIRK